MAYRVALLNFSKGEIAPELEARFDVSVYNSALRRARNVKVRRTGGVAKRMGTRFVAEALPSEGSRLIPFQFSDEQAYALEFAHGAMRPAALGGVVLEEGLRVTAISHAAQAKISCPYHGYSVGDQVMLKGILGMTQINDRFLTVLSVIDASNFTVDFNSVGLPAFAGADTGTLRTGPPAPPPPPPPVQEPPPPPPPPQVGSGSGGGYGSGGYWLPGYEIP